MHHVKNKNDPQCTIKIFRHCLPNGIERKVDLLPAKPDFQRENEDKKKHE
jgi:hypothetical protein